MDKVLTDVYYWAADTNTYLETNRPTVEEIPSSTGSDGKVRCIRDVTPDDLKEFRAQKIR